MRRVARLISLLVINLVLILLAGELVLRLSGGVPMTPPMFVEDAFTDYRNRPNLDERYVRPGIVDYRWTTNSLGFRGTAEYPLPKPQSAWRALILGDSFTFGQGVEDGETYPARLEQRLSDACPARRVEVINAGAPGYSASQSLAMLEHHGMRLQPDLVVYGFFVNDPVDNVYRGVHVLEEGELWRRPRDGRPAAYRAKAIANAIPGYEWLVRRSALVNWLRHLYFRTNPGALAADVVPADAPAASDTDSASHRYAWQLMRPIVRRMHDVAEAGGARFVVLLIPADSTLAQLRGGETDGDAHYAAMRRTCEDLGLECLDLGSWMLAHTSARLDELYIPKEFHFTPLGHELTATALHEHLGAPTGCAHSR